MPHAAIFVHLDVHHRNAPDGSAVRLLPAALGVEVGGIELERGPPAVRARAQHPRPEARGVGIVVVEAGGGAGVFAHESFPAPWGSRGGPAEARATLTRPA